MMKTAMYSRIDLAADDPNLFCSLGKASCTVDRAASSAVAVSIRGGAFNAAEHDVATSMGGTMRSAPDHA
jgi:hypothetical protein